MAAAKRGTGKKTVQAAKGRKPSDRARKAQLTRLKRRTADLMLAYLGAGRATPKLKAATRKLQSDINDWRDRTGGKEIRAVAMRQNEAPEGWTCKECDLLHVDRFNRLCFFTDCDPEDAWCSYVCIQLPPDPDYPVS